MKAHTLRDRKPSEVEWLGDIPSSWTVQKFRHVFRESPEKIDGEVVGSMLSVSGYRGVEVKQYDDDNRRRLDEDLVGYRIVRPDQLVVNTMWLNYAGLGVSSHEGHVSPAYRSYDFRIPANKRYIHHLMRSQSYVQGYTQLLTGIRPNSLQMSRADLMDFPILLPPLTEQTAIAAFLDRETAKIDALVEEQKQLIELLKEKRHAIVSDAVSKGLDADVPMGRSKIDGTAIPEHWTEARLTSVGSFMQGKAHEPYIDDEGKFVCVTARFVSTNGERRKHCYMNFTPARMGDIAMVMSDLPNGRALARTFHITDNDEYAINQRVALIKITKGSSRFFSYQLDRNSQLLQYDDGANQTHLPNRAFTKMILRVPPIIEQDSIAKSLDAEVRKMERLIAEAERLSTILQERRSALISAAVTGKVDVHRVDDIAAEAA